MISLTPIHKAIQKRLFEKSRILGREKTSNINEGRKDGEPLNHAQLSTRSTFLRMTSGQVNPVILMGGALKDNGTLYSGYDDVYGARTYTVGARRGSLESDFYDNFDNYEYDPGEPGKPKTVNQNGNRPMPGLKGIDVTFKGGERALREAEIKWTCWDWDELDILTPHFLAHGKTVMVEWGWVYNKKSLEQLPNFLTFDEGGNRVLDADVFSNYQQKIFDTNGDFDMMVGIVKNFEYTTRADGGFDCTTILTSVGASILDNPQPNEVALDPNLTYNLSLTDDNQDVEEKLIKATAKNNGETDKQDKSPLVDLNTSVTLKFLIRRLDAYILSVLANDDKALQVQGGAATEGLKSNIHTQGSYLCVPNKCLVSFAASSTNLLKQIKSSYRGKIPDTTIDRGDTLNHLFNGDSLPGKRDFFVRWGWFEDNVLSKFLSVTSDNSADYDSIVTQFRSIERKIDTDGNPAMKQDGKAIYESVRIKNHPALETTNIKKYILPGQFNTQAPQTFEIGEKKKKIKLDGDSIYIQNLANFVNDTAHFSKFSAGSRIDKRIEVETIISEDEEFIVNDVITNVKQQRKPVEEKVEEHGFLRNMLINTRVIKEAFGVSSGDEFTVESVNVVEAIQSMFNILNQELNFWSYNIVVDEIETYRAKIIDEQTTNFDFSKTTFEQKSFLGENGEVRTEFSDDEGVFYFPVWRKDSIVKTQNITAAVPDEMQLSIMYGANMDQLKEFSNPGSQFSTKEGVFVGGLYNQGNDSHKLGLDIAFRNKSSRKIGVQHGIKQKTHQLDSIKAIDDASQPLSPTEGDDVEYFLKLNTEILEETLTQRLKKLQDNLQISEEQREARLEEITSPRFNERVPPPLFPSLTRQQIETLLEFEVNNPGIFFNEKGEFTALFNNVFDDEGNMKPEFKGSVGYLTTQHGINKQLNTPLLIPLELSLEIDGIGGIYPGNSFHSTYLPTRYQKSTVFQAFDVNHSLDSSKWTTTISGKMRSTMANVFDGFKTLRQLNKEQFENIQAKAQINEKNRKKQLDEKFDKLINQEEFGGISG